MEAGVRAGSTGRFDYLDGIRAIAIGAVLALHWLAWYSPFLHGGSIGVDIFFVLSGFIITTMLWRAPLPATLLSGWWTFIRRRVLRLYPALLGLIVVSVLLYAVTPDAPLHGDQVGLRGLVVLGQGSSIWGALQKGDLWVPALHPFGQTWSLAIEWYFYLLWPLALFAARMRGVGARRLAISSLAAAVGLYAASMALPDFWFYFGPSARFAELLVGCALALSFQAGGLVSTSSTGKASVLALVFIAGYTLLAPSALHDVYRWVGVPLAVLATVVLIHAGYSNQDGPVTRLLSHRWLATVGRHSYSLYLWHVVPMLLLGGHWMGLPRPVLGLIAVAATVVLTIASYQLLERPFLRARSDVLKPGRVSSETSPAR